jgi:hypothetical protein
MPECPDDENGEETFYVGVGLEGTPKIGDGLIEAFPGRRFVFIRTLGRRTPYSKGVTLMILGIRYALSVLEEHRRIHITLI